MNIRPLGEHIREWRRHRRLSQMALALDAEISTRHLSFIENGHAQPSREMVLRIAEHLDVPLRARNAMLLAAGFAPLYAERRFDDPELAAARRAVDLVLKAHEPWPALAIDRHWNLIAANAAATMFLVGVAPELLVPPVNVLRLSLHPHGMASRIANLAEWRAHLLERLRHQIAATADPEVQALLDELSSYPAGDGEASSDNLGGIAVPLRLATPDGELRFLSTTTVFGTPIEVTLAELAIEAFLPADAETAQRLATMTPGVMAS